MKLAPLIRPMALMVITLGSTILLILYSERNPSRVDPKSKGKDRMARRSFILWLHGLGDSGPANEPIKTLFTSIEFNNTKWSFPSAPYNPVSCNHGAVMPSWFDIHELPVTAHSPKEEDGVLKAVKHVHSMIDEEIAAGTNPANVFVCGFSQGGALTLASVLLYPKTLGGGAVFSGWVPFNQSIFEKLPENGKKTPILWCHGMEDRTVLFEAGQAGPPFLDKAGVSCEFKAQMGKHGFLVRKIYPFPDCVFDRLTRGSAIPLAIRRWSTCNRGLNPVFQVRRNAFMCFGKI